MCRKLIYDIRLDYINIIDFLYLKIFKYLQTDFLISIVSLKKILTQLLI